MSKYKAWLYPEENTRKRLNIAATAIECDRNPAVNRIKIANTVARIMREHPETELILFGELILGWYDPNSSDYHQRITEFIPGETTEWLGDLSQKYGIYLCSGLSESFNGNLYNAQVLINPQGEIQAIHRKWNLKSTERQAGYKSGSECITKTVIKEIQIGLVICSDVAHPKTMRELMQSRLELILLSLADDKDEEWFMAKANARLYDAWVVTANRYGQENDWYWNGHIVISDPLGKLRASQINKEGYLTQEIRFAQSHLIANIIRNTYVKALLLVHVLKNWRILKSYYE